MPSRTSALWLTFALIAMLGVACGDDGGKATPDTGLADATDTAPLPDHPLALEVVGAFAGGATQTYDVGGTSFDLTIDHAYVVIGNVTVLGAGDPVPGFAPEDPDKDPLAVGTRSVDGYRVVDLVAGATFGPIDVPEGMAGPIYFATLTADRSTSPLEGADMVPDMAGAMLLLEGSIIVGGTLEKAVQFKLAADRLWAVAAPGFASTAPHTVRVTVSLDGWFSDMDVNTLTHSTNTIYINDTENNAAFQGVAARALEAFDTATTAVE